MGSPTKPFGRVSSCDDFYPECTGSGDDLERFRSPVQYRPDSARPSSVVSYSEDDRPPSTIGTPSRTGSDSGGEGGSGWLSSPRLGSRGDAFSGVARRRVVFVSPEEDLKTSIESEMQAFRSFRQKRLESELEDFYSLVEKTTEYYQHRDGYQTPDAQEALREGDSPLPGEEEVSSGSDESEGAIPGSKKIIKVRTRQIEDSLEDSHPEIKRVNELYQQLKSTASKDELNKIRTELKEMMSHLL